MRGKKQWFLLFTFYFLLFTLCGCEAFVRKFTRKSKKDKAPVEMVLAPEEWKGPQMTKEERYRQYFVFWQSWQDELINALTQNASQKKKLDCVQQAMKNLVGLRSLLNESKQKQLDIYLKQLVDLQNDIKSDIYGNANNFYRQNSEKLKMNISQRFSYSDVKNDIL
ncbi:MAG: hypothetical protein PHV92_01030 [Candidatus Omnitrophica bacterium]|nr:hypothetical protein [Candidatus Omnitrophota bacterium]MDD5518707.1 hypothetical protein [Candidatus Omnitrophota bacterium]